VNLRGREKGLKMNLQYSLDRETDLELLQAIWTEIKGHLKDRKRCIDEEIRTYPTPIPRCDAQFNYLLEQRTRLSQELGRITALAESGLGAGDYLGLIEEFIKSPPCTDDEAEQAMISHLKAELSKVRNRRLPSQPD
jgi:chorismate mutase